MLLLAVIFYLKSQLKHKKAVNLRILGVLGAFSFLMGLGIQAFNMSEIYSNICCGPDTEEIAQQVKQALLYSYAYNFLTVISLISWGIFKWILRD